MGAGIATATEELTGPRANPAVRRAIVIMTDGVVNDDPRPAAAAAAAAGIEVHVLVYPTREYYIVDPTVMEAVAGSADRVLVDPARGDLRSLARTLAGAVDNPNLFSTITITDQIPSNMTYMPGSANPPAALVGDRLVWTLPEIGAATGVELTYLLVPQEVGLWPTNVRADADFVDDLGNPGQLVFPIPYVRVWDASSMPHHVYLPATFGRGCIPLQQSLDVVLILDTSSSMSEPAFEDQARGTKLDAAIAAIDDFVRLMRRDDWAALVAFDATARVELPLTADRAAFRSALSGLTQDEGTQIDDGLVAAGQVLETRRSEARPAVVLLTDGRHGGEADDVLVAASEVKRSATLITIGLGENVDHTLLRSVASSSGLYYPAPTAADLADIYASISAMLPCAP
jgi:Mg-chelatase subunit ChlD